MKKIFIIFLTLLVLGFSAPVYADGECENGKDYYSDTAEECTENGGIPTKCGLPYGLTKMINDAFNLLKIAVPIVLIIMGMIDLLKAVASQKEDDIKKGWNTFAKRVIYGIAVFFVFFLVQFIVSLLPRSSGKDTILECVKTFFGYGDDVDNKICCIQTGANTNNNSSSN